MRRSWLILVGVPLLAACSSSSSGGGSGGGEPVGPIQTAAHTSFTMPNEVGKTLPVAEKAIRAAAKNLMFVVRAADATGRGRQPTETSTWKVCKQSVPAGQDVDQTAYVTLSVVMRTERCPQ